MFDIYNSFVQAEHTQGATNLFFIQFILAVFLAGQQSANPLDDTIDFETQVRPLLVQHCTKCHGAPLQKSGLRLDAKHAAFKGSDNGPVIVPGNADASELFRRITTDVADERMPSEGQPLNANEIKLLQRWIDGGANWPETDYDREAARDPRLVYWAWHWLDIAHYADTHGFERDQRRANAWHYRDWVIKSLTADLPYDQFLRDQISGDVLRPDDPAAVAATGFLTAGPWDFVGQAETPSPVLKRLARADDLDDMVTPGTVSCVRLPASLGTTDINDAQRRIALIKSAGLAGFCRALLNTNEFVYVD